MTKRTPSFGVARFAYDAEYDVYRCPQGQPLQRWRAKYTEQVVVYRAEAATCNACIVKAKCTPSAAGRQVRRSFHAAFLDRVRAYHATAAYQQAMRKRQVWVEPLFGEAKDWHGLRRFRLRGLWKVNCEALQVAAGQNLKRWLTRTGWGRRHGPAGSLALSSRTPMSRWPKSLTFPPRPPSMAGFSTGWADIRPRAVSAAMNQWTAFAQSRPPPRNPVRRRNVNIRDSRKNTKTP